MSGTASILIADDSAASRKTMEALLAQEGYQLTFAANGAEALKMAQQIEPDLILLDVMMPGMDGFEVCRRLRAESQLAEVPIIMVTALGDRRSLLQGLESGADDFIAKPFDRAELRARVRTVTRLNRYRLLSVERTRFQWVVEQVDVGYVLVDSADRMRFANPQARRYLELPKEGGLRDKAFLELARRRYRCQPEDAWLGWPDRLAGASDRPRFLLLPESSVAPALWLEVAILEQPLPAETQRVIRLRDVTAEITAQRQMRAFHTSIAHKLRTPLTGMRASMEFLALQGDSLAGDQVLEIAGLGLNGLERLQAEVEDVLRYLESPMKVDPEFGFLLPDLERLLAEIGLDLGLPAPRVSGHLEVGVAPVVLSPRAVEWVLRELLGNAKKFHPARSPQVEVSVTRQGQDAVRLCVSDDGLTLSPGQLTHVWTPYYQGEKHHTGQVAGMGLGLSQVAVLMWEVNGTYTMRNRPVGPGVVVELVIPLAQIADELV